MIATNELQRRAVICIETSFGAIGCELFEDLAPATTAYFLNGIDQGLLDGGSVFRILSAKNQPGKDDPIDVVQFGFRSASKDIPPIIAHETTAITGLRHRRGTLSIARFAPGAVYHSAFLCVSDTPSLDFGGARHPDGLGFAAFGQVIFGLDVLDRLHRCAEDQDYMRQPIPLTGITSNRQP